MASGMSGYYRLRSYLILLAIFVLFGLIRCPRSMELRKEIKEQQARNAAREQEIARRIEAIEHGGYAGDDADPGLNAPVLNTSQVCTCYYRRGTPPPTSCADPRCGPPH